MQEIADSQNIYQHMPELIGILIAVVSPFCIAIGVMMKKLVGRLETDLNKLETLVTHDIEDRLYSCEKAFIQIKALHKINHPGQDIE